MFAPDITVPALREMHRSFGDRIYGRYGFADAFHPPSGWVNPDVIGIDLGITLLSAENLRTGRVWAWFMRNTEITGALEKVGLVRTPNSQSPCLGTRSTRATARPRQSSSAATEPTSGGGQLPWSSEPIDRERLGVGRWRLEVDTFGGGLSRARGPTFRWSSLRWRRGALFSYHRAAMRTISRRRFLSTAAMAAAPAIVMARQRRARLPIAFSTLGCPKWPWSRVLEQAAQLGYAGIELRGIEGEMDLTKRAEFTGSRVAQSLKDLAALDLRITDLGASSRMHEAEPTVRAAQLDEGRRFIDLAHRLKSPYVRVFGDKIPAGEPKAVTVQRVIDGLRTLGEHAKGSGVGVIIESHGDFTDSPTLLELLKGAGMPTVALLWDAHHTFVSAKEDPRTPTRCSRRS